MDILLSSSSSFVLQQFLLHVQGKVLHCCFILNWRYYSSIYIYQGSDCVLHSWHLREIFNQLFTRTAVEVTAILNGQKLAAVASKHFELCLPCPTVSYLKTTCFFKKFLYFVLHSRLRRILTIDERINFLQLFFWKWANGWPSPSNELVFPANRWPSRSNDMVFPVNEWSSRSNESVFPANGWPSRSNEWIILPNWWRCRSNGCKFFRTAYKWM